MKITRKIKGYISTPKHIKINSFINIIIKFYFFVDFVTVLIMYMANRLLSFYVNK
jgi:hypothetical protein